MNWEEVGAAAGLGGLFGGFLGKLFGGKTALDLSNPMSDSGRAVRGIVEEVIRQDHVPSCPVAGRLDEMFSNEARLRDEGKAEWRGAFSAIRSDISRLDKRIDDLILAIRNGGRRGDGP